MTASNAPGWKCGIMSNASPCKIVQPSPPRCSGRTKPDEKRSFSVFVNRIPSFLFCSLCSSGITSFFWFWCFFPCSHMVRIGQFGFHILGDDKERVIIAVAAVHPLTHFSGLVALSVFAQQPLGSAKDGKDVAIVAEQRHFGVCILFTFFLHFCFSHRAISACSRLIAFCRMAICARSP